MVDRIRITHQRAPERIADVYDYEHDLGVQRWNEAESYLREKNEFWKWDSYAKLAYQFKLANPVRFERSARAHYEAYLPEILHLLQEAREEYAQDGTESGGPTHLKDVAITLKLLSPDLFTQYIGNQTTPPTDWDILEEYFTFWASKGDPQPSLHMLDECRLLNEKLFQKMLALYTDAHWEKQRQYLEKWREPKSFGYQPEVFIEHAAKLLRVSPTQFDALIQPPITEAELSAYVTKQLYYADNSSFRSSSCVDGQLDLRMLRERIGAKMPMKYAEQKTLPPALTF